MPPLRPSAAAAAEGMTSGDALFNYSQLTVFYCDNFSCQIKAVPRRGGGGLRRERRGRERRGREPCNNAARALRWAERYGGLPAIAYLIPG